MRLIDMHCDTFALMMREKEVGLRALMRWKKLISIF